MCNKINVCNWTNILTTPPPLQLANLFIALLFPPNMYSNLTLTHITDGFSALDMYLLLLLLTYWGHVCWRPCLYSCSYAGKTTCFLAYLGKERNQIYWVNIKRKQQINKLPTKQSMKEVKQSNSFASEDTFSLVSNDQWNLKQFFSQAHENKLPPLTPKILPLLKEHIRLGHAGTINHFV